MRRALHLFFSCALAVLTACGGGQSTGDRIDPLALGKPTQADHVVVGVPAQGRARVLRGPNALEVKHGPEYDQWPRPFIEALRVVIAAEADWAVARRAIDREIDREGTRLTLEVVEDGRAVRTLELPVRLENLVSRALEPPPLDVRLARTPEGLEVAIRTGGAPWFTANGCDLPWSWRWTLEEGALPPDAERVVRRVVDAWRDLVPQLYARVAVEGDAVVRAAVPVEVLARLTELGVPCFDLDLSGARRGGRITPGGAELALHWLARHRTTDGLWAADAESGSAASARATGLALCAFVGASYTFRGRHAHAQVLARALQALPDPPQSEFGAQAIVAALLTKLHADTEAETLHAPTTRALTALHESWRREAATPVATGFAALALASRTEISPPVDAAFAGELLDACRRLAGSRDDQKIAVGAAGCVLLGDDPQAAPWRASYEALLGRLSAAEHADAYAVFFATIVAIRMRGEAWTAWRNERGKIVMRTQNDGPIFCAGGSWQPAPGSRLGRVETTALNALILEVVYRYGGAFGAPTR